MEQLSLLELNQLIQKTLKDNLEPSYWVVAEIGALSVNQKGHCYLELIENENDKIVAKTRATIWSYTYSNLSTWFQGITGQSLSEGMKILANVKVTYHELYGFNLNIQDIDANYTLGEKERIKQQTIKQLVDDGVFEMNKELSLPMVPQKIAIISSLTAAGYGDFIDQLDNNPYSYYIDHEIFPAIVQGEAAPQSIIKALHGILNSAKYEMVVLIRGGGSQLDLDCFNDYDLCANIAQFPLPIITGIGHERDETIADLVAHTRQKTPTAVAEFILQGFISFESKIIDLGTRITRETTAITQSANLVLQQIGSNIFLQAKSLINAESQSLLNATDKISYLGRKQIQEHNRLLETIEGKHRDLDPKNTLKRGYSFTTLGGNSIFNKKVKKSDKLLTYTLDQIIESTVIKSENNDKI